MNKSLMYWVTASYRSSGLAEDASPVDLLARAIRRLVKRWQKKFNEAASDLATSFVNQSVQATDSAFIRAARTAEMTVKFKFTDPMRNAYKAVIGEQVGLIRTIASHHLSDVETLVMRSVAQGGNMGELTKQLKERYALTQKRAALIARDQNHKATAVFTKVRQVELLGDEAEAVWNHSGAGRHPRPTHVAKSGQTYKVSKGMFIDGKWIYPGTEINCRCFSTLVIP